MAHLLLSVIGAVAQFERDLIRERQREGIALANSAMFISAVSGVSRLPKTTICDAGSRPAKEKLCSRVHPASRGLRSTNT